MFKFTPWVICTLLLLPISSCSRLPAEHTVVNAEGGRVVLPLRDVNDGRVHFYTYKKSGKRINFFVRTDGKGNLSAYFDACFTCSKHKKGYRCEGTDLVCNECNMRFRLAEEKWVHEGGCSPISLKSITGPDSVVIVAADIEKGERLFK